MDEERIMNKSEFIKDLRALTQAGMKDCKDALEEANFDLDKAVDIIKKKGLNLLSGRDSKVAVEGRLGNYSGFNPLTKNLSTSLCEVNCETDFVSNNSDFIDFTNYVTKEIFDAATKGLPFDVSLVENKRNELVSKIKEKIVIRRWWVEEALQPTARVFSYIHSNNKLGSLLTLLAPSLAVAESDEFIDLGVDLAMQVAAMNPLAISSDLLDPFDLDRQKNIFTNQLVELNKPQSAWQKILDGKLNKWYSEVCLVEQDSIVVDKTKVKTLLDKLDAKVVNFVRCKVGEGIEVKPTYPSDFVNEVAQLSGVPARERN
jgi:elongation factor Ts